MVPGRENYYHIKYELCTLTAVQSILASFLISFSRNSRTPALFFRLNRELQALQQTMNKHIVCVYGWVKWSGLMGLVLEYMPGGNISRFLDDDDCRSSLLLFLRIFPNWHLPWHLYTIFQNPCPLFMEISNQRMCFLVQTSIASWVTLGVHRWQHSLLRPRWITSSQTNWTQL